MSLALVEKRNHISYMGGDVREKRDLPDGRRRFLSRLDGEVLEIITNSDGYILEENETKECGCGDCWEHRL